MNISKELQTLIDAALEDGKLSEKEKQVLYKRAEKDGLDLDEFELYLDSLFYKNKKTSKNKSALLSNVADKSGLFKETKGVGGFAKKGCLIYVYGLIAVSIIAGIYSLYVTSASKLKYDCSTVDDCLTIYQFEGARYVSEGSSDLKKIIISEAAFLIENDEFDRALKVLFEGKSNFESYGSYNEYYETEYTILNSIVDKLLFKDNYDDALKWANKACNNCNLKGQTKQDVIDYYGIGKEGENRKIEDLWDENETMDMVLLRKIENARK